MSTSDDAHSRRAARYDRSPGVDPRNPREALPERTWSQSQARDPRQPSRPQDAPPAPPRAFSGHSPRYDVPPAPPPTYSRHDYEPLPADDRVTSDPAWNAAPPRYAVRDAAPAPLPPEPQRHPSPAPDYYGRGGAYEPEVPPLYPAYDTGHDSLYDTAPQSLPPRAHAAEPVYDNYGQAPAAENPYGRGAREPAQAPHPRYAEEPGHESYERTLGARIARDAAPSRFYLPEEQPAAQGYAQPVAQGYAQPVAQGYAQPSQGYAQQARTPAGHEQLYDPTHFDPHPLDEPASHQTGATTAYDDSHGDAAHWGAEAGGLDERYRGGLPAEHHRGRDELDADFFSDEDEFDHDEADLPPRKSRKKLIAAVLVGAATIGGGGAYVYKTVVDGGAPTGAPVIRADAGSAKETPSDPGGRQFAGGEKTIYDRLTPDGPVSGSAPERVAAAAERAPAAAAAGADRAPATSGAGSTLEDRIEEALRKATRADGDAPPAAATRAGPDQPIVVRSETYRPDGTRVEAAAPAAGPRAVMDTANLPPPFGSGTAATPSAVAASPASVTSGIVTTRQVASVAAPPPAPEPVRPVVETRTVAAAAPPAPAPQAAPAPSRPAAAQAPVRTAALPPAAAPASGGHFVQLRASQDERRALAEINELNDKFGVVLGGVSISSRTVDLGEKGVWFRLLAGPLPSKDSATELCNKLKGAGLPSCLVRSE